MIEPTGERFIPEHRGGQLIEAEHVIRYLLAATIAKERKVLDAGCGVGWGSSLLLDAGASSVCGLDLDAEAIANAKARAPKAQFVEGDLGQLPWPDDEFDLVVCFEAIEHVPHQEQVLNELIRVLAPAGVLLVSSPNPRVYPGGNPFHIHELTPEELVSAVSSRLANVTLFNQHEQTMSVLVERGALVPGETSTSLIRIVRPLESGTDPYSLVAASDQAVPSFPLVVGAASSSLQYQLTERVAMMTARVDRLRELEQIARYPRREPADPSQLMRERDRLREDRERLAAKLFECEQRLAESQVTATPRSSEHDIVEAELRLVIGQLEREYAAIRNSSSWRLTRPLRALSELRGKQA